MEEERARTTRTREPEPKICFLSMMGPEQVECARGDCAAWNPNEKYSGCMLTQAVGTISYNLMMMMKRR